MNYPISEGTKSYPKDDLIAERPETSIEGVLATLHRLEKIATEIDQNLARTVRKFYGSEPQQTDPNKPESYSPDSLHEQLLISVEEINNKLLSIAQSETRIAQII